MQMTLYYSTLIHHQRTSKKHSLKKENIMYADDTVLLYSRSSSKNIEETLTQEGEYYVCR